MDKQLREAARKLGVSPIDIYIMIKSGEKHRSGSPLVRAFWDELSPDGTEPTVEDFLRFVLKKEQENGSEEKGE